MIWHQILWNGLQSTVLALIALMLVLVLIEEVVATITATALVARTTGTTAVLRAASTAFLSGVHFICNLKADALGTVPNASSVPFASTN